MGSAKKRERREDRPGVAERQRIQQAIQLAREKTAERVHKHRAKLKEIAEYEKKSGENSNEGFHTCALKSQIRQLVTKIQPILAQCRGICRWQLLLEKFLWHHHIKPSLRAYYLSPKEAAVQLLIEGLKTDLEGMKGVQSRDKLAWKGALLSAAVRKSSASSFKSQDRALARVLYTNRKNIYKAMKRRQLREEASSSQWALLSCRKQVDQLHKVTKDLVTQWWHQETHVGPIQK